MPGDDVPSPDTIAHALEQKWLETLDNVTKSDADRVGRWLSFTPFLRQAEESDRRIPDGPPIRFTPDIERPTITFLSGRTDDERTPNIKD
jgi:hypothetical protein